MSCRKKKTVSKSVPDRVYASMAKYSKTRNIAPATQVMTNIDLREIGLVNVAKMINVRTPNAPIKIERAQFRTNQRGAKNCNASGNKLPAYNVSVIMRRMIKR